MQILPKYNSGFTLIELMVVVSIMLITIGGSIAGFINFNDRQNVVTAAKEIQTLMRGAQIKARTGEQAAECAGVIANGRLRGYQVTTSGNDVVMNRVCYNANNSTSRNVEQRSSITMDGVSASFPAAVEFLALKGGVDTGVTTGPSPGVMANTTITITGSSGIYSYQFQVTPNGQITEGAVQ